MLNIELGQKNFSDLIIARTAKASRTMYFKKHYISNYGKILDYVFLCNSVYIRYTYRSDLIQIKFAYKSKYLGSA